MAKAKTLTAKAVEVSFTSVSDIALQHGQAENKISACAEYALDTIKGFPVLKEVSEENVKALRDGYSLHHLLFSYRTQSRIRYSVNPL